MPLHTALFATAVYGVNNLMYAYVTFLNVALTYGMETAFFRFANKREDGNAVYTTALTSLIVSSLTFTALASIFSKSIATALQVPQHPEYVVYFACIIGLDTISAVPFAYLRQQNKALKFALIKNVNIFTNIALNLYFLLLCPYIQQRYGVLLPMYGGQVHLGYVFIANLIASIITIPLLAHEIAAIKNAHFDKTLWKEMLRYGLPLMVVGFAGMINETLDRIVISYVYPDAQSGLEATGIYGANYKLAMVMSIFIQAFRYAAEPFFFAKAKEKDNRIVYAQVMNYFVIVCSLLFLTVMLFLNIFKHFIDKAYWDGLTVVPILLMANLCLGIYFNLSIWFKLTDQTQKGVWISVTGAMITLVGNFLLIPILGYEGCAWTTLICYASMAIMGYVLGAKYYPIPYQVWRILAYIGFVLLLFGVNKWLPQATEKIQYGLNALYLGVFVVLAYLFERKNKIVNSPS